MYTGNRQPSAIRKIFGVSPTPNQMITSGTSPSIGTALAAWITGSSRSSPSQNSPHSTASATPAATPSTSPSATRCSEMSRLDCSTPCAHSCRAASATATGEATSTLLNTPCEPTSCHRPSTASVPPPRRASRRTRTRAFRLRTWTGRTSVTPPAPGLPGSTPAGPAPAVPGAAVPGVAVPAAVVPGTVVPGTAAWPTSALATEISAMLRRLLVDGVVPAGLGGAEQRRHAVRAWYRLGAGQQRDHVLQRRLHRRRDRHEVRRAAGREDELGQRRGLVLDVHVVVGDPLALVRLLPVLGLDQPLVRLPMAASLAWLASAVLVASR